MSSAGAAEEEEEPEALESIKPVTLTQDSDGSIILHCASNGGLTSGPLLDTNKTVHCLSNKLWLRFIV